MAEYLEFFPVNWEGVAYNGPAWTQIENYKVKISFEDAANVDCGGSNTLRQSGFARRAFMLNNLSAVTLAMDGNVETLSVGWDAGGIQIINADFIVVDQIREGAVSNQGEVCSVPKESVPNNRYSCTEDLGADCTMEMLSRTHTFNLPPGLYLMNCWGDTKDGRFHKNCYWELGMTSVSVPIEVSKKGCSDSSVPLPPVGQPDDCDCDDPCEEGAAGATNLQPPVMPLDSPC